MANVTEIEGIGAVFGEKLAAMGITTTDGLLAKGGTAKGREEVATQVGAEKSRVLDWVNRADLMRIKGVGSEFSDLLEAAGVDTVKELATRKPDNLHAKLAEVNEAKKLVRRTPTAADVEKWVAEAKTLPAAVQH